jgi:hypothetical protein
MRNRQPNRSNPPNLNVRALEVFVAIVIAAASRGRPAAR